MMNLRNVVMGLGLLAMFGTGCIVEVVRGPYEACKSGEACSNGTVCTSASYTSNGGPATYCSINCSSGAQCPVSPYGSSYLPTCVVSVSAGTGLCYDTCISNFDCGVGTICASIPGTTARICVPTSTTSTTCGAAGQSCCAGSVCATGLACNAGVCAAPVACGGAGQACCTGNACSAGLTCSSGVCNTAATANRTPYQKCNTATDTCGGAHRSACASRCRRPSRGRYRKLGKPPRHSPSTGRPEAGTTLRLRASNRRRCACYPRESNRRWSGLCRSTPYAGRCRPHSSRKSGRTATYPASTGTPTVSRPATSTLPHSGRRW